MSTLTSPRTSGGKEHEPAPTREQQKAHALGLTYQSLIIVLAGVVLYALLKARRENPSAPADSAPSSASQQS